MYLLVPKLRKGGYIPFFVTEKRRSEQALIQVIQEAFINGVSTRKIERLAQSLGIEKISASQVSRMTQYLDEQVEAFRKRTLEAVYPVIWVDALYEKLRMHHRVRNVAVLVVMGITLQGNREVLAVEPMYQESEETYRALFRQLKARDMKEVWLCVSDAHAGLKGAIGKEWIGCSWQRCKVHFMRNILAHVAPRLKGVLAACLKQIWQQPDREMALRYGKQIIADYRRECPRAMEILAEGLEDSLQFYAFEALDKRKVSSTNVLERLHREIRRRSRVVGIFPSVESYLRLVTCYLLEYTEDWASDRRYISKGSLLIQQNLLQSAAWIKVTDDS